jgi:hypothetical protein
MGGRQHVTHIKLAISGVTACISPLFLWTQKINGLLITPSFFWTVKIQTHQYIEVSPLWTRKTPKIAPLQQNCYKILNRVVHLLL